jgi:hypothetical protein
MRFGTLLSGLLITGCGLLSSPPPDWVTNRNPLESCGTEDFGRGDGVDVAARTCLLQAYEEGRGAELITTGTSVEGDPITRYVRVHENGTVEVFVDATRDSYGSGEWERLRCDRLVGVAEFNDPPDLVFPASEVFVEDGCESLPIP